MVGASRRSGGCGWGWRFETFKRAACRLVGPVGGVDASALSSVAVELSKLRLQFRRRGLGVVDMGAEDVGKIGPGYGYRGWGHDFRLSSI